MLSLEGQGHWPDGWKMRGDDRSVLDSLARKGMVVSCPERRFRLTHDGHVAASYLNGWPTPDRRELGVR